MLLSLQMSHFFASTSASITAAPRSFNILATELFPLPIPPVTPIIFTIIILSSQCSVLFRVIPAGSCFDLSNEWYIDLCCIFHALLQYHFHLTPFHLHSFRRSVHRGPEVSAPISFYVHEVHLYTLTIAILMMSAAVPWIGMFIAARSPKDRTLKLEDFSSGRYLLLPNIVST